MLKRLGRLLRIKTIRNKLLIYFFLTTFTVGITTVYTYFNSQNLNSNVSRQFKSNLYFKNLLRQIEHVRRNLSSYLETKSSEDLKDYLLYSQQVKELILNFAGPSNVKFELMARDVMTMVHAYLAQAEQAVTAKRGRNINLYVRHFEASEKILSYLNFYVDQINILMLDRQGEEFLLYASQFRILQFLNLIMIIDAGLLSLFLILWFTRVITDPIVQLSRLANKISAGNFEVEELSVPGEDEISSMALAFNKMKNSISEYISQLQEKSEVEKSLMEQKLKNMRMKNLLKNAELKTLQSQIKPHFIFNTLNAGIQLATMEEAEKTAAYMDNLSNLFRMNMRKFENSGCLGDEVESLNYYAYILRIRFSKRFRIAVDIAEQYRSLKFPVMIFQPLVENAITHGLKDKEEGGKVDVLAIKKGAFLIIRIKDNGKGMDKSAIREALGVKEDTDPEEVVLGQIDGASHIGLSNVIQRLRLFYDTRDVITITSEPGEGTTITLTIPLGSREAVEADV